MNTTQLECFIHVSDTLNFVRASQNMNMSQPALSKQIMSLENELGVRLLDRTTRSVRLTPAGRRFLSDARFILDQINDARKRVESYDEERLLAFRIGYSDEHELQRIGMVLQKLRELHPRINPVLEKRKRDDNLTLLKEEKLDIVLALQSDLLHGDSLEFHPLIEEQLYCLVPENHPLRSFTEVTSEQVRHYPQVLCFPYSPVTTVRTSNYLRAVPLNAQDRITFCDTSSEAYALTLSGVGIAILPNHLLVPFPALRIIPISDSKKRTYGIYCNPPGEGERTVFVKDFLTYESKIYAETPEMKDLWPSDFFVPQHRN